jgi:hypothetical protein
VKLFLPLKTPNAKYTSDIVSTMKHTTEYFIPEGNENSDSAHHDVIRQLTVEPLDSIEDDIFRKEEMQVVIETFEIG